MSFDEFREHTGWMAGLQRMRDLREINATLQAQARAEQNEKSRVAALPKCPACRAPLEPEASLCATCRQEVLQVTVGKTVYVSLNRDATSLLQSLSQEVVATYGKHLPQLEKLLEVSRVQISPLSAISHGDESTAALLVAYGKSAAQQDGMSCIAVIAMAAAGAAAAMWAANNWAADLSAAEVAITGHHTHPSETPFYRFLLPLAGAILAPFVVAKVLELLKRRQRAVRLAKLTSGLSAKVSVDSIISQLNAAMNELGLAVMHGREIHDDHAMCCRLLSERGVASSALPAASPAIMEILDRKNEPVTRAWVTPKKHRTTADWWQSLGMLHRRNVANWPNLINSTASLLGSDATPAVQHATASNTFADGSGSYEVVVPVPRPSKVVSLSQEGRGGRGVVAANASTAVSSSDGDKYWLRRGNVTKGPVTKAQMHELLKTGKILKSDMVASSPDGPWKRIGS